MTAARLIGGRYEIGELLGYGGMAEVRKGRDVRLGRDVAVKVLRADLARDPSFQNRFRREAQAAAGLNHPSIVAVYDTGEDDGPEGRTPYIVMEYVEGHTLREVLKTQGRLAPQQAMEITAEVCAALDFSHRSGIVHRDIKPGNVMITDTGAIKVMDFGIARALADNAATVTATAAVIGTAQYLSPEQARGESVDARSDVYSTGCLLYELLTGHPPFTGDSPVAIAYQHVRENPQVPSSVNNVGPAGAGLDRDEGAGQEPAEPLPDRRRDARGPAARAGRPAGRGGDGDDRRPAHPVHRGGRPPARPGVLTPNYDEEDDTAHHRGALIWTAVVLALLLVIGGAALYLLKKDNEPNTPTLYQVPALVGLSPAAAIDTLRANHLIPAAGKPDGSNGPCSAGADSAVLKNPTKGQVCTQNPAAGKEVADGTTVSFTVYAGPADVLVQQVVGLSYSEAQKALASEGLAASRSDVDSPKPAGQVIGQDPPANASVPPGTTVKLQVANGKVKLPDVTKLTEQQARAKLNQLGFTTIARSNTAPCSLATRSAR